MEELDRLQALLKDRALQMEAMRLAHERDVAQLRADADNERAKRQALEAAMDDMRDQFEVPPRAWRELAVGAG
jgi:cell division protein FtsB